MCSSSKNASSQGQVLSQAQFFSHRLEQFLSPFLLLLDRLLDRRLVATFLGLCQALVRHRNRPSGLLLSELGGVLLSPDKAPAGTKRISNLLRSPKWLAQLIVDTSPKGPASTWTSCWRSKTSCPCSCGTRACRRKLRASKARGCALSGA